MSHGELILLGVMPAVKPPPPPSEDVVLSERSLVVVVPPPLLIPVPGPSSGLPMTAGVCVCTYGWVDVQNHGIMEWVSELE